MNKDENYFFISYNQKNGAVNEDLAFFEETHANHWIDRNEMRATDDTWINRAEQAIFDGKCKGAIFYFCENALRSSAVEKEIDLVCRRRKENPDFFALLIIVGGRSIHELIRNVYASVEVTELAKTLPLTRIAKICELFPDEKIFIVRDVSDLEKYREALLRNLNEYGVILNKEAVENELRSNNKLDVYSRYSFGTFYGETPISDINLMSVNTFEEWNGYRYVKLADGSVRAAEEIKWIILDYSDGKMKLISEKVLEKIPGKDIDRWLNDDFYTLAFSTEEKEQIVGIVSTLSYQEYLRYSEKNSINPTNGKFWLNSVNERSQPNMLMCVSGERIDRIGLRKDKTYGIRPVIEIKYKEK